VHNVRRKFVPSGFMRCVCNAAWADIANPLQVLRGLFFSDFAKLYEKLSLWDIISTTDFGLRVGVLLEQIKDTYLV